MARKRPRRLTPVEALIMDCLWDLGEATVRQAQRHLKPVKPMAYNSVLTMMRILREKGFLQSDRRGRMDVYRPLVTRKQMGRRSLEEVLHRFFAGSAEAMVSQLLAWENLSPEQIKAIRREANSRLREDRVKERGKS
jgi:predicted transcriptional regulator